MNDFYKEKFIINCKNGEKVVGYNKYLLSKHWKSLRQTVAKKANWKCSCCNIYVGREIGEVHHLTYNNVGCEKFEELQYLCSKCHKEIHEVKKKNKTINKRKSYVLRLKDKTVRFGDFYTF